MNIFSMKPSRLNIFTGVVAVVLAISSWFSPTSPVGAEPLPPSQMVASLFSFSGTRPNNLGVQDGHLADCPDSPNCVSSESADTVHHIDPLAYGNSPAGAFEKLKTVINSLGNAKIIHIDPLAYGNSPTGAFEKLKTVINSLDNAKIIREDEGYLYAEFTSAIMGFVDDVEFYLDEPEQIIRVRSASRLGESDLGVNRKRIETIRDLFNS